GTIGQACAGSGTLSAVVAKRAVKIPDFNMFLLLSVLISLWRQRLGQSAASIGFANLPAPDKSSFPKGHHDRVAVVEDQVDTVRIMDNACDPMRRADRAKAVRQVFFAHDVRGAGRRFAFLGEFLPNPLLAVITLDI